MDSNSSNFQADIKFYRIDIGAHLTVVTSAIFKYRIFLFLSFTFIIKVSSPYPLWHSKTSPWWWAWTYWGSQSQVPAISRWFVAFLSWLWPQTVSWGAKLDTRWHWGLGMMRWPIRSLEPCVLTNQRPEDRGSDISLISRQYPQISSSQLWRMTKYLATADKWTFA